MEALFTHEEWKTLILTWIVLGFFLGIGLWVRKKACLLKPGKIQALLETAFEGLEGFTINILGPERGKTFIPLIQSFFFFILFSNLIGLFPFSESPTNTLNTTIPIALISFFSATFYGLKKLGFGYFKRFLGPIAGLAPLMLFIEIMGEFSKPFSLSVRLFANVWGEELANQTISGLVPLLVPLLINFLMIFTDFIQSFVFIILTMVYINMGSETEH